MKGASIEAAKGALSVAGRHRHPWNGLEDCSRRLDGVPDYTAGLPRDVTIGAYRRLIEIVHVTASLRPNLLTARSRGLQSEEQT